MMACVICPNERFLIHPTKPVREHYRAIGWLLPHGVAGACALLLAPLQLSKRLCRRLARLHRVVGRIYAAGVLVLAPLGACIQYSEEPLEAPRSSTFDTVVDAVLS